jgi:hypothetical protein
MRLIFDNPNVEVRWHLVERYSLGESQRTAIPASASDRLALVKVKVGRV